MKWNGEFWEGNTSANTAPENTLTAEKLMAAIRALPELPPPPMFDLYGSPGLDQCYEITPPDDLRPPGTKGRRFLVCPKDTLDFWAYELRRHGADVRVEPRLRSPDPTPPEPT